jgi:hypothetical protein
MKTEKQIEMEKDMIDYENKVNADPDPTLNIPVYTAVVKQYTISTWDVQASTISDVLHEVNNVYKYNPFMSDDIDGYKIIDIVKEK